VQIDTYKLFGAPESEIEKFKKDPKYVAKFWAKRWIEDLKKIGFSIDWRRTFITTQITPTYSQFIQWQYNTLRKLGCVEQGTHPVIWCTKDKSPTGDHDRLEGEGVSPTEYIIIKFKFDDCVLPCGTLRPETIFGVTNIWLNPNGYYAKVRVDDENWILSMDSVEKLSNQLKDVVMIDKLDPKELFGKKCINPITNKEIPILPSEFVDTGSVTGVVMSVPSHAPYDWTAIKEITEKDNVYGIGKNDLEPLSLINVPDFGELPAKEMCEKLKINNLKQRDLLDEATKELYKKEFHKGVLNNQCGEYSGKKVSEAKEIIYRDFIEKNVADIFWDCENVICRCRTKCIVKILENQWFLKYSDEKWKTKVRKCIKKLKLYPDETRQNFENTVDWMKDKACTRKTGLGTPLPWDKEWIVETLSDSTIYMAYYTISHILKKNDISAEDLTSESFDFIFLGKGKLYEISKKSGISKKALLEMKNSFEYYYPVDMRISGKDLIQNHFVFYLYHHTALWKSDKWPRAIGINGHVNIEGEKMSKSKGNVIPLKNLIEEFGADLVRINIACSAEDLEDADWRVENVKSYRSRLEFIYDIARQINKCGSKKSGADAFLESRLNRHIKNTTEFFENLKFRSALQHSLFESTNDLKWYIRRSGGIKNCNKKAVQKYIETVIKLIAPVVPHFSEEVWSILGKRGFVSLSLWPTEGKINNNIEKREIFVKNVMNDVLEIQKLASIQKPKIISIFIAEKWKFDIFYEISKNRSSDINNIIKKIMQGPSKKYGKATLNFIYSTYKKIHELEDPLKRDAQMKILSEAAAFYKNELGCNIKVLDAEKSEDKKARLSTPQKPGIHIE
jgi:leucyl-tRNA synthetase